MASESVKLRERGNELYRASLTFGSTVKRVRLDSAQECYERALTVAANLQERACAHKNLAIVNKEKLTLLDSTRVDMKPQVLPLALQAAEQYREALFLALTAGTFSVDWLQQLQESSLRMMQFLYDYTKQFALFDERRSFLERGCMVYGDCSSAISKAHNAAYYINYSLAEFLLQQAIVIVSKGATAQNVKLALNIVRDAHAPITRAASFAEEKDRFDVEDMQQRLHFHDCMLESARFRTQADARLREQLEDEEHINMDAIWEIADCYRQAIVLTREIDVEGEAIACYSLGLLYEKVLQLKPLAHANYRRAIELGMSLYPRVPTSFDWYNLATAAVARFQAHERKRQEEVETQARQPFLDALKDELEKLQTKKKSDVEFLKYLYATHLDPKNTLGKQEEFSQNMKKTLLQAVKHYHPDKQHGSTFEEKKRKVLFEEICKILNSMYENYK